MHPVCDCLTSRPEGCSRPRAQLFMYLPLHMYLYTHFISTCIYNSPPHCMQIFLNENMAAQDLMCWMEIEAFRGIPPKDGYLRDLKARELRMRYFTKKYLLGPRSPASKEAQRQVGMGVVYRARPYSERKA